MARKRAARRRSAGAKRTAKKAAAKTARKSRRKPAKKTVRKSAGRRPAAKRAGAGREGLLTLTEVSKRTGISMPTLQRYKKEYQKRLQTVGKGRTQRYKVESLDTFRQIKKENLKKRGRPRKVATAKAGRPAKAKAAPEGLISLSEIGRRTGISYPTLLRYVRLHGRRIPSHGTGRKRRFPVEAVPVFSQLRRESRRGRRKGTTTRKAPVAARGLETRMRQLEKSHAALERQMKKLIKALQKPVVKGI